MTTPPRRPLWAIVAAAALATAGLTQAGLPSAAGPGPVLDPGQGVDTGRLADISQEVGADGKPAPHARTTVFTRGEGGYHTFRIPAMVETTDGTLLAFAEARVTSPDDDGDIDIVLKRSTDGGRTWGPIHLVADDGPAKRGNPVPIVDQTTGRIVLNTTRTGGGQARSSFVQYSDDDGVTWSEPVGIPAQVFPSHWGSVVGGPGHGVQITQGEHAGRLVVPGRHNYSRPGQDGSGAGGHVLLSDDGGETWRVGATDEQGLDTLRPNEVSAVELADGRLYLSARDQGETAGHRVDTTSSDGGETFDEPYDAVNGVVTSTIQGSLTRLPARADRPDRIVLSVLNHPTSRERLTLWSSFNDGTSWAPSYEVYDGPSAYSDLVVFDERPGNREIGVLFEGGERFYPGDRTLTYHHDIYFTRVPERLLDAPTPPPEVTPDAAGDHDALISGTPDVVTGKFGKALELAGDFAELPLTDALSFGAEPFTAAAWFRTDYLANNQALLYAHNRFGPRWWVQVEPGNNRVRAQLSTDRGSTRTLNAPGDFGDNAWHHVALVRDVDGVALYIDGQVAATGASMGTGSVSAGVRTGIRVGSRVDGINAQFIGAVDEVWLFDTALTAAQIAELATDNTVDGVTPATHLPMHQIVRR